MLLKTFKALPLDLQKKLLLQKKVIVKKEVLTNATKYKLSKSKNPKLLLRDRRLTFIRHSKKKKILWNYNPKVSKVFDNSILKE